MFTPSSPGNTRRSVTLRTAFLVSSPYYHAVHSQDRITLMNQVLGIPRKTHVRSHTLLPPLTGHKGNDTVVTGYYSMTRTGEVGGRPKTHNQDCWVGERMGGKGYLFAVCDGHGEFGHQVAGYVKGLFPREVLKTYLSLEPPLTTDEKLRLSLKEGYRRVVDELSSTGIDVMFSGTTCVSVVVEGKNLVCGNVGDSRAVLVRGVQGKWESVDLSTDHKPSTPSELQRIQSHGGRVSPYYDSTGVPIGPSRVWMQDEDIPGLAMSRSIGDLLANRLGVSSEPEMVTRELQPEDKAVILASDGVWEFFTSQEVAEIVGTYYTLSDLTGCARHLIAESVQRWRAADTGVDDITLTLVFLHV